MDSTCRGCRANNLYLCSLFFFLSCCPESVSSSGWCLSPSHICISLTVQAVPVLTMPSPVSSAIPFNSQVSAWVRPTSETSHDLFCPQSSLSSPKSSSCFHLQQLTVSCFINIDLLIVHILAESFLGWFKVAQKQFVFPEKQNVIPLHQTPV